MSKIDITNIIPEIDKDLLSKELNADRFIRKTNYGNNEIYIISQHNSPNVMLEIGRLREISFRLAGGGTGKSVDIDGYDTAEHPYQQLIVWDPEKKEILGGYRFINCNEYIPKDENGNIKLATTGLLNFSEKYINEYLPYTIELGRSFIRPEYQSSNTNRKALFSLDNLWDGLGALIVRNPKIKYFMGKITMYENYDSYARDLILYFFKKYFTDKENLVLPKEPLIAKTDEKGFADLLIGENFKEDFKIMNRIVRDHNEIIPPLFNTYMNLSPSMRVFGTAINNNFGGVEETGIMITIDDIYESKKHRHVSTCPS
ncbi:MAG: hemolysin [Bacteroidetes bacterium 4572_117]|nr:MAG: hemolysin [Bacteroidetes bacterium 4572_117]